MCCYNETSDKGRIGWYGTSKKYKGKKSYYYMYRKKNAINSKEFDAKKHTWWDSIPIPEVVATPLPIVLTYQNIDSAMNRIGSSRF